MTKTRLIKRLKWYYPLEKFHTFFTFPLLLFYLVFSHPIREIIFLSYGLIVCIVILYQGQLYWKLKLQRLKGKTINQEHFIAFFRKSKKINIVLLTFIPLVLLIQLALQEWKISSMFLWGVLANAFAVSEHINYYQTQLMYDNTNDLKYIIRNKSLKRASLAKDLIENKI